MYDIVRVCAEIVVLTTPLIKKKLKNVHLSCFLSQGHIKLYPQTVMQV